jgi:hypothetical protein
LHSILHVCLHVFDVHGGLLHLLCGTCFPGRLLRCHQDAPYHHGQHRRRGSGGTAGLPQPRGECYRPGQPM